MMGFRGRMSNGRLSYGSRLSSFFLERVNIPIFYRKERENVAILIKFRISKSGDNVKYCFSEIKDIKAIKQWTSGEFYLINLSEFKGINKKISQLGLDLLNELTTPNLHRPHCEIEIYCIVVYVTNTQINNVICYSFKSFYFIEEFVLLYWMLLLFCNCFAVLLFQQFIILPLNSSHKVIFWFYFISMMHVFESINKLKIKNFYIRCILSSLFSLSARLENFGSGYMSLHNNVDIVYSNMIVCHRYKLKIVKLFDSTSISVFERNLQSVFRTFIRFRWHLLLFLDTIRSSFVCTKYSNPLRGKNVRSFSNSIFHICFLVLFASCLWDCCVVLMLLSSFNFP